MKDRTLHDQKRGVRVNIGPIGVEGKWAVRVVYTTSWGAKYTTHEFITPPLRTVDALKVLRGTFEMHRTRRAAESEATTCR